MGAVLSRPALLLVGVAYPAYRMFKDMEDSPKDVALHQSWLMYWCVYASFASVEYVTDRTLCWFPWYYSFKIWVLWMLLARRMRTYMYMQHVAPLLRRYRPRIDAKAAEVQDRIAELQQRLYNRTAALLGTWAANALRDIQQHHFVSVSVQQGSDGDDVRQGHEGKGWREAGGDRDFLSMSPRPPSDLPTPSSPVIVEIDEDGCEIHNNNSHSQL